MLHTLRPRRPLVAALAALALVATACGEEQDEPIAAETEEERDDLEIVATTSVLGDVAENLLGEDGTVEVIMPPGTDPHGFEPSARDAAMLREADLVIANGLQLEEGLLSALEAAEEDGVEVFTVADLLDPIAFDWDGPDDHGHDDDDDPGHEDDGHAHDDDDDHGHEDDGHAHDDDDDPGHEDDEHAHGPEDPHVWHDPVRMADGVHLIAEQLASVSEVVDAAEWERRAEEYADELLAVHEEIEEILAEVPDENRLLITNHDAFGYLAARYDLEVLGTVIPGSSTDVETNPQQFSELIETLEEAGVPAVFSENTEADRLIEQLASEVGDRADLQVEVVQLYSDALGEPGSDGETYVDMLLANAQRIADGLG